MSFTEEIKALKEKEKQVIERAYAKTPTEYHGYILLLDQNMKVRNTEFKIDDELKSLGVFTSNGKTYLGQRVPYLSVDGRLLMAVDEALKKGTQIEISAPDITEISKLLVCNVTVKTARGISTGSSKIGIGGRGVDSTNPFENAQTSAIGRALAFQGYGLIGTGIASADEIALAMKEQGKDPEDLNANSEPVNDKNKKDATQKQKPAKNDPPKNPPANADAQNNSSKSQSASNNRPKETSLGTHQFALRDAKLMPRGDKSIWAIAVERLKDKKQMTLYVNPELGFDKLELSQGEVLDIAVSQSGTAFLANQIKRAS